MAQRASRKYCAGQSTDWKKAAGWRCVQVNFSFSDEIKETSDERNRDLS
jgi:hypothetical protein